MIAVIFEVVAKPGLEDDYLGFAGELRSRLEQVDGFISVERFRSLANPEKLLSLSFWRDQEAVRDWRTHEVHRAAQQEGRSRLLQDYRLRVAEILRDYGMDDRTEVPPDSG